MPSLLHSTMMVEDGGGLTLQGSTTVWPTKASTVEGSVLSMVTSPRVKLRTQEGIQGWKEGRKERNKRRKEEKVGKHKKEKIEGRKRMKESLYALLLVLLFAVTKASIKIADNLASEVYQRKLRRKGRDETQLWHTNGPCNTKSDGTNIKTFTHKTSSVPARQIKGDVNTYRDRGQLS